MKTQHKIEKLTDSDILVAIRKLERALALDSRKEDRELLAFYQRELHRRKCRSALSSEAPKKVARISRKGLTLVVNLGRTDLRRWED